MHEHRSLLRPPVAAVLGVNGRFLAAALMGFMAWVSWPSSLQWWPLAIISAVIGIAAIRSLIQALVLIFQIYSREREIAAMLAHGRAQRQAHLANANTLRKARMTDD